MAKEAQVVPRGAHLSGTSSERQNLRLYSAPAKRDGFLSVHAIEPTLSSYAVIVAPLRPKNRSLCKFFPRSKSPNPRISGLHFSVWRSDPHTLWRSGSSRVKGSWRTALGPLYKRHLPRPGLESSRQSCPRQGKKTPQPCDLPTFILYAALGIAGRLFGPLRAEPSPSTLN